MQIEEHEDGRIIACFKTTTTYYPDEESDQKNNTVREFDESEAWQWIREYHVGEDIDLWIRVTEVIPNTGKATGRSFERKVRNISFWKSLYIITWHPKDDYPLMRCRKCGHQEYSKNLDCPECENVMLRVKDHEKSLR